MVAMAAFAAASELYLPIILCVFTSRSVRHFETFPLQRRFYCSVGNLSPIPPKRPDVFEAPVLGTLPRGFFLSPRQITADPFATIVERLAGPQLVA